MKNATLLASILLVLPLAGCLRQRMVDVDRPIVTTESGVSYEELLVGDGEVPELGQRLGIDYICTLPDGTEIDSTRSRGQRYEFVFGEAFPKGIDDGIQGMHVGGRRRIVIPPAMAYGEEGVEGLIPPGTDLVFELELVEIIAEDE